MSKVYFAPARARHWDYSASQVAGLERLIEKMDFGSAIAEGEYVAIKTHFGSEGAHRIVRPVFLRKIVEGVKAVGGKPFVCDTVRIQGWDYLEVANQNGINPQSVGCPVILADGLFGCDSIEVKAGPVLGSVRVASAIHDAPAMIVVSHCKGHIEAGYGGAIKNLAMGGAAGRHRSGDWQQARGHLHAAGAESSVVRDAELCIMCLQCLHVCPTEAISEADGGLVVDSEKCWRCGRCERVCPEGAIRLQKRGRDEFQMALAEGAKAVLSTFQPGKVLFFNFVLEVQPECDCMPMADTPLVQDRGILASRDIVAVEQAALDLINKAVPLPDSLAEDRGLRVGQRILAEALGVDGQLHVDAAARIGLGSQKYELIEL
ncbi:MAG: DUF362 domain-containing protein [Anaerolineae bacterium]|jgi:uncharacterized Fe-S center protein|nr:DUF362 domain-containing protein [Anaerolineae bacterium]MDH7472850.1 DUF362 domain-containing protein [Anaerolineae bacterium]